MPIKELQEFRSFSGNILGIIGIVFGLIIPLFGIIIGIIGLVQSLRQTNPLSKRARILNIIAIGVSIIWWIASIILVKYIDINSLFPSV